MSEKHKRKKQPELVRAQLLEAAARVIVERGLHGLTLDLVAQRAELSKGGLIHHFPSKQILVEELFHALLAAFGATIQNNMAQDPNPRGRFTRAYIRATAAPRNEPFDGALMGACAFAMSGDKMLVTIWRDWLQKQVGAHADDNDATMGSVLRFATDGLWLDRYASADTSSEEQRQTIFARLVELSHGL